jgi:hypothetical protein
VLDVGEVGTRLRSFLEFGYLAAVARTLAVEQQLDLSSYKLLLHAVSNTFDY